MIPAYQASAAIGRVVADVKKMGLSVIVVDDASNDGTAKAAEAEGARVIRRPANGGKGAALRDGIPAALQMGCDWVLTLDADGQHLVSEIPLFLREAERGGADLLVGNRMGRPRGMPLDRWVTNLIMSRIISKVAGQKVLDTQCGFRMIHCRVMEKVRLTCDRFEVETEMVIRAAWAGFRIASVPVSSVYRRQISFIRPLRDTLRFFLLLSRLRKEKRTDTA
ncbi:MAG: glycosyltransferase family 2 protein [Candidatus Omnitrophota bacterium]|nr:glycosyltransferase family 2 protein [Candidatus Omnitrophota bacterium]